MATQLPTHHHHQPQRRAVDLRIPAIEKYAYCLCLHVKPTTIFIAVFKLIRALLSASIYLNAEFSIPEQVHHEQLTMAGIEDRHRPTAAAVNILTRIITASVSAVGIYAVISGRAALLMPLYAMLLVDFFFTLPAFYNKDLDSSFSDGLYGDYKSYPTGSNQYSRYSLVLFSLIGMMVRIYFLCVIWKCYRYLRLIELVSPIRLSEIYPHIHPTPQYPIVRILGSTDSTDLGSNNNIAPPPYETIAANMKPPNYEEAMKSSGVVFAVSTHSGNPTDQLQNSTELNSDNQPRNVFSQVVNNVDLDSSRRGGTGLVNDPQHGGYGSIVSGPPNTSATQPNVNARANCEQSLDIPAYNDIAPPANEFFNETTRSSSGDPEKPERPRNLT